MDLNIFNFTYRLYILLLYLQMLYIINVTRLPGGSCKIKRNDAFYIKMMMMKVDKENQWSEMVRIHRFSAHLTETETMKGYNKRKSFVDACRRELINVLI